MRSIIEATARNSLASRLVILGVLSGASLVIFSPLFRASPTLEALHALEVRELRFPADTAARLAELRVITGLKMPDCCVLLAAEDGPASVASFDERLAQAADMRNLPVLRS